MPETWTGNLIGQMHNNKVSYADIANELGVTKSYISMILNSKRNPPEIQQRMEEAFAKIMEHRLKEADKK